MDKLANLVEGLSKIAQLPTLEDLAKPLAQIVQQVRQGFQQLSQAIDAARAEASSGDTQLSKRLDGVEKDYAAGDKQLEEKIRTISLIPGPKGEKGDKGDDGEGYEGPQGPKGPKGEKGDTPTEEDLKPLIQKYAPQRTIAIGGRQGFQLYVDGEKVGLVQILNLLSGTGISFDVDNKSGVATLSVDSTGGGGGATWYLGEQITLGEDNRTFTLNHAPTAKIELLLDRQPQIYGVDFTGDIDGDNKTFAFTSDAPEGLAVYANYQ
jgi:hypothetical protein